MDINQLIKLQTGALEVAIKENVSHLYINEMILNLKLLLECQKAEAEVTLTLAKAKGALEGNTPPTTKVAAGPEVKVLPIGTAVYHTRDGYYTLDKRQFWTNAGVIVAIDPENKEYVLESMQGNCFRVRICDL